MPGTQAHAPGAAPASGPLGAAPSPAAVSPPPAAPAGGPAPPRPFAASPLVRVHDPGTARPPTSPYTTPIVSVNRSTPGVGAFPGAPGAPARLGTPGAPGTPFTSPYGSPSLVQRAGERPMRPPFIISNSLAAASGLGTPPLGAAGAAMRRASASFAPQAPGNSPQSPARPPAVRLPASKDMLDDDEELRAARARTQARVAQRLADDHARCLQPDVKTPFRSARDVVDRLLPYHVWQVPERDLLQAADAKIVPRDAWHAEPCAWHAPVCGPGKRRQDDHEGVESKRKKTDDLAALHPAAVANASEVLTLPPFPTEEYMLSVYRRRAELLHRFTALSRRATSDETKAPCTALSLEQVERLAYEDESRQYQELLGELRRVRAELEEVERQRGPRPSPLGAEYRRPDTPSTPPVALRAAYPGSYTSPAVRGSPLATYASGSSLGGARPLPALSQAAVSQLAALSSSGAQKDAKGTALPSGTLSSAAGSPTASPGASAPPPPAAAAGAAPTGVPAGSSGASANPVSQVANGVSIPSQPLPLVVPISSVARLTALGIDLVPAPHLVPALSLASAGQSVLINPGLTAPRPLAGPQSEPVMLVGIAEAPAPGGGRQQQLHLSVVLSRLRPDQLSGLATLMQDLQGENHAGAGGAASPAAPGGPA